MGFWKKRQIFAENCDHNIDPWASNENICSPNTTWASRKAASSLRRPCTSWWTVAGASGPAWPASPAAKTRTPSARRGQCYNVCQRSGLRLRQRRGDWTLWYREMDSARVYISLSLSKFDFLWILFISKKSWQNQNQKPKSFSSLNWTNYYENCPNAFLRKAPIWQPKLSPY
jgi:hypothetical protein